MSTQTSPIEARIEWSETLDRIRNFVASRVNNRQVAEDITQDVIVRSIASGALDRVDNPIGWLIRSASNAVIDHFRTHHPADTLDPDRHTRPTTDYIDGLGSDETLRQLAQCLQPLVAQLEPPYRDALLRVDIGGHTQQQAALDANISLSGMKSRVQRGRHQLKRLLTACCEIELDSRGQPTDMHPHPTASCGCAG
jgi:RNA polymerase sigma-70 factor (ECF subfamily)